MKLMITLGVTIVGTIGSWIGAMMDHGNYFGGWSIFLGTVGSFLGIWLGYRIGKDYL